MDTIVFYVITLNGFYIGKKDSSYALTKHWRTPKEQGKDTMGYSPRFWVTDIKRAKIWNDLTMVRRFAGLRKEDAPFEGYMVEGTDGSRVPLDDIRKK